MNIRVPSFGPGDEAMLVGVVRAATEASDRLNVKPLEPVTRVPKKRLPEGGALRKLDASERELFRALSLKFPPSKCLQMIARARSADA